MVMTSSLKTRNPTGLTGAASDRTAPAGEAIPAALAAHAAIVRTRRGQTISLTLEGNEALFIVQSGALMVDVTLPEDLRQVVGLLYPGDVLRSDFAPPHAAAHLSAVSAGEVLRLRWSNFLALAADDPELGRFFDDAAARQTARRSIHMAAVGRFDCQQRVATFLLELALRTGVAAPCGGIEFEMPLSRTDMADYLGLNADTLSRTMSRLRASGLLSHPDRRRALIRDFEALAARTPAAKSLMALYGDTRAGRSR